MYGVVTRNAEELEWPAFDLGFYEAKDVSGRTSDPVTTGVNMISCFGDNATGEADPSLLAVNADGEPATRERPYFDWSYVCPSRESYREDLLATVESCAEANPDVRLDDVGFPRAGYCFCEVCEERFEGSPYEDRFEWRADVIRGFVEEAVERIPGRTYLTLYPDPYPGHLYERSGLDIDALEPLVDEFVVPLYDTGYGTTYWLEVIAEGFADRLGTPFSVELYAVEVEVDALVHAAEVADEYGTDVFFAYDAANARAAVGRLREEGRDGAPNG